MKTTLSIDEFLDQLVFSEPVFEAHWSLLSGTEKIDYLISKTGPVGALFTKLAKRDDSAIVRMLAYSPICSNLIGSEDFGIALADQSPLVNWAAWAHKDVREAMASLSHEGRKVMMGLRRYCSAHNLVEFTKSEIERDPESIPNACELFSIYCRNKYLISDFKDPEKIKDGEDFFIINLSFKILWQFAASAPRDLSDVLAWGLPLGNERICEIPEDIIKGHIEITLACRKYKPLMKRIEAHPEMFDTEVIKCSKEKYQ